MLDTNTEEGVSEPVTFFVQQTGDTCWRLQSADRWATQAEAEAHLPAVPPPALPTTEESCADANEAMLEICAIVRCEPSEVLETVQRLVWASEKAPALLALQQENERLAALVYIGDHHFPDLTWKARCEEFNEALRAFEKRQTALLALVTRWEEQAKSMWNATYVQQAYANGLSTCAAELRAQLEGQK